MNHDLAVALANLVTAAERLAPQLGGGTRGVRRLRQALAAPHDRDRLVEIIWATCHVLSSTGTVRSPAFCALDATFERAFRASTSAVGPTVAIGSTYDAGARYAEKRRRRTAKPATVGTATVGTATVGTATVGTATVGTAKP